LELNLLSRTRAVESAFQSFVFPVAGDRKPVPFAASPFIEIEGRSSPDGRWIAYASDETGRSEIYVQPVPPSGAKWQISSTGGTQPSWRRDGKELFYLAADRNLMAAAIASGATLQAGVPKALFETRTLPVNVIFPHVYQPSADGRRFLRSSRCLRKPSSAPCP
jgi:Tol biopolymer transport system component